MISDELSFPKGIQSVMVFSEAGIPLFVRSTGVTTHKDNEMISGFLSAVFSLADKVIEGPIRAMDTGNSLFMLGRAGKCIFVVQGSKESNILFVEFILQQLTKSWTQHFGITAEFFDGIMYIFEAFKEDLQMIFQTTPPEDTFEHLKDRKDSITFLLQSVKKKGLDKVLGAIMCGENPVVVVGDSARVNLAIKTLEHFSPYELRTIDWTDQLTDVNTVDLVGMSPTVLGEPADNIVVLDLEQSRVIGGQTCKYAQEFLNELEALQEEDRLVLVTKRITQFSHTANQLIELYQKEQLDNDSFNSLFQTLTPQAREIIFNICKKLDPDASLSIEELYNQYNTDVGLILNYT